MKSVLLCLFFYLYTGTTSAQTIPKKKLDSFITALSSKGLVKGSLVISQNGRIQYQKNAGQATLYRIGSVTKLFTAVLIFQLLEENKLSLDEPLSRYFPDLPNAASITIKDMLYHRSGLHDYTIDTDFTSWMDKPQTPEDLLKRIKEKGSDFKPGERAAYSNSNFLLLGYIIEKLNNTSYATFLKNNITSPLKMTQTWFGSEAATKSPQSQSFKYTNGNWIPEKSTDLSIHGGAGSIVSSSADLVVFMDALFANKLISKVSLAKMQTIIEEYGMGIFTNKYGSKKSYGHNGRIEEFYSALWYFPEIKMTLAYCTNGIHYPRTDLIEGVLKICFNEPFSIPFSGNHSLSTKELASYTGNYSNEQLSVNSILKGNKLTIETKGVTFELEPIGPNYFMHSSSGYYFEFFPQQSALQIKETDNIYYLKRKPE
jgi:CubicO group peptidase (beta-lactamase class C family)